MLEHHNSNKRFMMALTRSHVATGKGHHFKSAQEKIYVVLYTLLWSIIFWLMTHRLFVNRQYQGQMLHFGFCRNTSTESMFYQYEKFTTWGVLFWNNQWKSLLLFLIARQYWYFKDIYENTCKTCFWTLSTLGGRVARLTRSL